MKKFIGKLSWLEANPRKPRKFSTENDLHYTVAKEFDGKCVHNQEWESSAEVIDISMLSFMLLAIFLMLNYKSTH